MRQLNVRSRIEKFQYNQPGERIALTDEDEDRSWVAGAGHPSKALPSAEKIAERERIVKAANVWPPQPTLETPVREVPASRRSNPYLFVYGHRLLFAFVAGALIGVLTLSIFGVLIGTILGLVYGLVDGFVVAGLTCIMLHFSRNNYRLSAVFLRWLGPLTTLAMLVLIRQGFSERPGRFEALAPAEIILLAIPAFVSWIDVRLLSVKLEHEF